MLNKRPLPAPPHKMQIVDENGVPTPAFQKWLNELYVRVGELLAPSNLQIEETIDDHETRITALEP
jgi:hypothetical protein